MREIKLHTVRMQLRLRLGQLWLPAYSLAPAPAPIAKLRTPPPASSSHACSSSVPVSFPPVRPWQHPAVLFLHSRAYPAASEPASTDGRRRGFALTFICSCITAGQRPTSVASEVEGRSDAVWKLEAAF